MGKPESASSQSVSSKPNRQDSRPSESNALVSGGFFYGWVILAIAIVAQALTAPGQTVGVSEFKHLFAAKLDFSDRTIALYYFYGTALGSLGLPIFGYLIDRMGCRFAMILVAILFGTTCFFAGHASNGPALLMVFTFLRMLGQGALSLVASTMVSYWFKRRLAFAYSIMSIGLGVGMMSVPYVFKPLFQSFDLVVAFQLISLAVFLLVPIGFFLIVDRPRMLGWSQDGVRLDNAEEDQSDGEAETKSDESKVDGDGLMDPGDFTFVEAIATRSFWIVTAIQSAWALVGTGLVFNRKDIFDALGASEFLVDLAVPGLFAAVIVGQLVTGLYASNLGHRVLFTSGGLGMAFACGLILLGSAESAFAGFTLFGFSQGIFIIMGQSLWADYYGRSHIGKIRGLVWMIVVFASSLGGFALTLGNDPNTRFLPVQYSMWVMFVLSGFCLLICQPTKPGIESGDAADKND